MTRYIILLQALASTPREVARVLRGVDNVAFHRRLAPDTWSLAEVLSHLVDIEGRYRTTLQGVLQEECPTLPALRPDEAAHDSAQSLQRLLGRFDEARAETVGFLSTLQPEDWTRMAVHETRGKVYLQQLAQHLVDHDRLHLNQLASVRRFHLPPLPGAQPAIPLIRD